MDSEVTDINNLYNEKYDPYIFKRANTAYDIHLSPVSEYFKQSTSYISKMTGMSDELANKWVKKALKTFKLKNPEVTYNEKQENGDMEVSSCKLTDYIKNVLASGDVVVPSFTTYMHPSKEKSLHADFLSINIAARKSDKKMSHKFEQASESETATPSEKATAKDKALYYEVMQKTRKVANNSLSGAYASKSSILFNPSAHYTLTSMTRCVASIGNAITESMVAGNKMFKTPQVVLNYLVAIVSNISKAKVNYALHKYNLHVPTPEEILKSIKLSSDRYWLNAETDQEVLDYLNKLDDAERAAVLYTNDMWNMRNYNEDVVRILIRRMIKRVEKGSVNQLDDLYHSPEGVTTTAHFICANEIKGKNIEYDKMVGSELLETLASTTRNISTWLIYYKPLIEAFFTTDILPLDITYIREMLRDVIVLSDTDSTCGSYDEWVRWYCGEDNFETVGSSVAACVMMFNTQAMDHNIKQFARNMNIDPDRVELLKMKNEFYWPVFITANKNKHYFAMTAVKEGNVFAKPKLERKGVHLIASAIDQDLVKVSEEMMIEVSNKIIKREGINLFSYVKRIADIEREIIRKIDSGAVSMYKLEKVKNKDSYKNDEDKSPYMHHIVWREVFAAKYGSAGDPMYMVVKIPLKIKGKNELKAFMESIKDTDIRERWLKLLDDYDKDSIGTFKPPVMIVNTRGIPEEVKAVIDIKRIVFDNCTVFYNILESLGFYRKPKMMICEMGY